MEKVKPEDAFSQLTHMVWIELDKLERQAREFVDEANWHVPPEKPGAPAATHTTDTS